MTDQHQHFSETDDLDWLAYCYVVDELSPPQRIQFESRLAIEQAARTAVAKAVELNDAILMADIPSLETVELATSKTVSHRANHRPGQSTRRGLPALVFAASIMLALFALSWLWNSPVTPGSDVSDLALAWSEFADEDSPQPAADFSIIEIDTVYEIANDPVEPWTFVTSNNSEDSAEDSSEATSQTDDLTDDLDPSQDEFDWMLVALTEIDSDAEGLVE